MTLFSCLEVSLDTDIVSRFPDQKAPEMDDDRYTRITLRIPKDLHAMLQDASDASSKSINAEIIERVRRSFGYDADLEARVAALERLQKKK